MKINRRRQSTYLILREILRTLFFRDKSQNDQGSNAVLKVIFVLFVVLIGLASYLELDQVVTATGQVVPAKSLQTVEHYEGGRVQAIHVKAGDQVDEGDILISLSPIKAKSELAIAKEQAFRNTIRIARLRAEFLGSSRLRLLDIQVEAAYSSIVEEEIRYLGERLSQYRAEKNTKVSQLETARSLNRAASASLEVTKEENRVVQELVARGLESKLSLVRSKKDLAQAVATYEESMLKIRQEESSLLAYENDRKAKLLDRISELELELSKSKEELALSADRADRVSVRSPITGTVNRVLVATEGGTVTPGEAVVEIVPAGSKNVFEAKVSPADIGFVSTGQSALLKFSTYDFSIFGQMIGQVGVVGSDSVSEDNGERFYVVRIEMDKGYITKDQKQFPIIPGMTGQVDIVSGKRSLLEYIFSPVVKVMQSSFREK